MAGKEDKRTEACRMRTRTVFLIPIVAFMTLLLMMVLMMNNNVRRVEYVRIVMHNTKRVETHQTSSSDSTSIISSRSSEDDDVTEMMDAADTKHDSSQRHADMATGYHPNMGRRGAPRERRAPRGPTVRTTFRRGPPLDPNRPRTEGILVRVVHPSGTGGSTLCYIVRSTCGAFITGFQNTHNCNLLGAGPGILHFNKAPPDAPWRRCDVATQAKDLKLPNWIFLEYAFDVEYPCEQDNVKHVMLFRDPWKRKYSMLVKKKRESELPRVFSQFVELMTSKTIPEAESSGNYDYELREFVRKTDNPYIRFLIGSKQAYAIPFRGITREHLEMAKRVIDGFDVLLETEDLDNAGLILTHVLGDYFQFPEDTSVLKHNVHAQPELPENYEDMRRLFEELNSFDRELYEYMASVKRAQHAQWEV